MSGHEGTGWVNDWYCVAWEGGLPFDPCSPENPTHGGLCGPWRRQVTPTSAPDNVATTEWGVEIAPGEIRGIPASWVEDGNPPKSGGKPLPLYRRTVTRTAWVPAAEKVHLTQLVGRTIEGETVPVGSPPVWTFIGSGREWRWLPSECVKWRPFPAGTLDLATGMVSVRPKGDT